jgi:acyl-CoA thioester hydrolase
MNAGELTMACAFAYRFRVRHDELDSFGHLNNAVCVKYMQEAAIQASTDAGYSLPWYDERGVAWVIRRLEIRYYLQVRYGEELEVTTWITECSRSTCIREYDVTRTTDGARVARGRALWVYIDSKSGRPLRLPHEIKIALSPAGEKEDLGIRGYKSRTVEDCYRYCHQRQVQSYELDPLGRVHHTVFLTGSNRLTIMLSASPVIRWRSCARAIGWFSREVTRLSTLRLLATMMRSRS